MSARNVPGQIFLRPYRMFYTAGYIWVVDSIHPVAALMDPASTELVRLVDWSHLTPGTGQHRSPTIVPDAQGLWIQYGLEDSLALVTPGGVEVAAYSRGARLIAADVGGAWLAPKARGRRNVTLDPNSPPPLPARGRVWHVDRSGAFTSVPVDGRVRTMTAENGRLFIALDHEPWSRVPVQPAAANNPKLQRYEVEWTQSWVSWTLSEPRPPALSRHEHDSAPPIDTSWGSDYADESYNEIHLRKRADDDGLRWHWGRRPDRGEDCRVRVYRDGRDEPLWEREIRDGRVMTAAAAGGRLWVNLRSSTRAGGRSRVEVWDPITGHVSRVAALDDLDIAAHRWPVGPEPADHLSYVDYMVSLLDGMRFHDSVSDVHATWVGQWPDGYVRLSYHHSRFPELELRSSIGIYYFTGAKLENVMTYVRAELWEQAGTLAYPDASHAVDGVLNV